MASAHGSARVATVMLCVYVPGARRTSSCKSGCEPSPNSTRLTSVTMAKQRSTSGSRPLMRKPASVPQTNAQAESVTIRLQVWPEYNSVATVMARYATPATMPTSTRRVRVRTLRNVRMAVAWPPIATSRSLSEPPSMTIMASVRLSDISSANGGL